jgi:hypothetical protein
MSKDIHIKKSFLLSGQDFPVTKSLNVKHPTVQEVLDIDKEHNGFFSEDIYYIWVSIFTCDPYDYMVYLDDKKIDYENIDSFDLFILLYEEMMFNYKEKLSGLSKEEQQALLSNSQYGQAFNFFFNKNNITIAKDENNNTVIGDCNDNSVLIDRDVFAFISEFIKQINGIYESDKINPEDNFAKQILIDDERARLKKLARKPMEEVNNNRLGNLLSTITWVGNGGISPFNRNDLHMYDLVDGIHRTDKLLNYNHTMTGLYSGCVDKDKLDMQKISWQT